MTRRVFWTAGALVAYTYAGFPALVLARGALRPRPHRSAPVTPSVSVVVAARNEAPRIAAKIDNLLGLDYPADRLEVIVASDGSVDGTVSAARSRGDSRVRVLDLPCLGKADVLNAAAAAARGDVLVFTDANSKLDRCALRALVAPFADPEVGGVAGDQRYTPGRDEAAVARGERRYWQLDRALKRAESRAGNVISATGAIYAIRRELFVPAPAGVTDDFAVSTAVICQGRRLVFAADAVAREPVAASTEAEFERKVRVITRGLGAVLLRRELLDPRAQGFYALQLLSHKVLRRLMPLPLVALFGSSLRLAREGEPYRIVAGAGSGVLTLGAAGLLARRGGKVGRLLTLPSYFLLVNLASVRAVLNLLRRRPIERWEPRRP